MLSDSNQNEHRPSRTLSANVPLNDKYMISNNPGSFPIKESQINEWHQTPARMSILMSWLSLVTAQKPAAARCQLSRFMRCHSQHNWHNVSERHTSAQKPSLSWSAASHWSCDDTLCQNGVLIEIRSVRLRSDIRSIKKLIKQPCFCSKVTVSYIILRPEAKIFKSAV